MKDTILELNNVRKSYGNFQALKGIDLTLNASEILGFIGPNGAGKTTTIKVILGMIKAQGTSRVFDLDSWKDAVEIHKYLSYVPGDVNLWPNLTGGEVIDFFLMLKKQKDTSYKHELIKRFDLDPTKKCKTYSKGNRQKVALIAALSSDVSLYIFDEPTSGLDPLMETLFQEEVRQLKDQGKSILLSSHILSEVEQLCDTINIIKEGKIIEKGNLQDMRHLSMSNIRVSTEKNISGLDQVDYIKDYRLIDGYHEFKIENHKIGEVIAQLSQYEIKSFESRLSTLEELFMGYYGEEH
ncbi:ABC transporter ATP-binding protein [Facklamia sp. DSM 111018]|uniref:ABC transporter ATP-binding protein n=1 Tax=Facklamia lactis TaxID=2749967 RepID=A0ABS0LNM6_9LACT|nr:ABC transporter ATP-binding protein [Facklamia lactis]MBG9985765.1 ABC transporter ATP-binding protein [Facklamia lactis]